VAEPAPLTRLLTAWREGDLDALDQLTHLVYAELKRLAARQLQHERHGHTLTPTALVAEAFLRLSDSAAPSFEDRAHFFAAAARHMRHILVDFARSRGARKRGQGERAVTLDEGAVAAGDNADLVAVDEALTALAAVDERKARVVELHFFGGMALKEIGAALGVHHNTVLRDLRLAEAWLNRYLST